MNEKDKEILLCEETAKKLADMMAKWLMPDVKILEGLSLPSGDIEVDEDRWTWKMPHTPENKFGG